MNKKNRPDRESKVNNNQGFEEAELSDQELGEVVGGITPIPIPGIDLSRYLQKSLQSNLKSALNPKEFDPGGGI